MIVANEKAKEFYKTLQKNKFIFGYSNNIRKMGVV